MNDFMKSLTIRSVASHDLAAVAAVHSAAFPEAALTRFGRESIRRYYQWQFENARDLIFLVAWFDGRVVGFVCAGSFRHALGGFVRREWPYLVFRALSRPWLLLNRLTFVRVKMAVRLLSRSGGPVGVVTEDQNAQQEQSRRFGVLSLATHPSHGGRGVGRTLMAQVETHARSKGVRQLRLTVDPHNDRAVDFYSRLGWRREPSDGAWSGSMVKDLH